MQSGHEDARLCARVWPQRGTRPCLGGMGASRLALERNTAEGSIEMSNIDTLRDGYEAFGRGDLEGATQNFADDIRWENPEAPQLPNSGVIEGKDTVKQLFAELGDYWESFSITLDEFI